MACKWTLIVCLSSLNVFRTVQRPFAWSCGIVLGLNFFFLVAWFKYRKWNLKICGSARVTQQRSSGKKVQFYGRWIFRVLLEVLGIFCLLIFTPIYSSPSLEIRSPPTPPPPPPPLFSSPPFKHPHPPPPPPAFAYSWIFSVNRVIQVSVSLVA